MADIDAELAELEAEVENEAKAENKQKENKSNSNVKKLTYSNNKPQPQQKSNAKNYNVHKSDEQNLDEYLNSGNATNNTKTNSNYQKNSNRNPYSQQNNYNNYNFNNNYKNNYNNQYYNNNNNYYNNGNQNQTSNYYHNYNNNNGNYNNNSNYYKPNNNINNNYYNPQKNNQQNNYNPNSSHTQVKPKTKNQNNQNQAQPKIDPKNSSKTQIITKSKEQTQEPKEDIYPSKQENMYHKLKEMKSLTVLEEEIALCDKIISFKKKRGLDYDDWENKKDLAKMQLNNTKALIESGGMDFEAYKKIIISELAYEKKILKFTESDKISKPYELSEIKRRINRRIDAISKELTQNPEESQAQSQKPEPNDNQKSNISKQNESGSKTTLNPKSHLEKIMPQDSDPNDKKKNEAFNNIKNNFNTPQQPNNKIIYFNQIPKQYIVQQKVLTTDPKTGKQMYAMKNVIAPKYEQYLKQKGYVINKNPPKTPNDNNNKNQQQQQQHQHQNQQQQNQHMIQQKVLVTDPKTGKQMYVMKNVVDPKYAQQKQNNDKVPNNQKMPLNNQQAKPPANNQKIDEAKIKEQKEAQNKIKEEIKKYQLYINTLIKEYTEAKEYFKRNNQEALANKSRKDLAILISAKQKVDMGRYKEVKLNLLPKTITPEYIYGYTENERMQKFKVILGEYIKQKNEIDGKMKSILEKMKKMRKKELEKAKEQVKPKLDEMKARKDNYIKLIETLKEKFKDKWTPAPEYTKVMVEDKIEKVSFEGAIFGLKIKVGKTDYDKDKTYLKIKLEASKNKILNKDVHLKQMGDYNEEWKWDFNGDEFKNIAKNYLFVELYRQHTFSDDKKGQGKIDLSNIKRGTPFKSECKIEIESKRVEPTISFLITPVMPEGKKYYETTQKESIKITKIYPAFTGKQQIELPSNNNPQTANQSKAPPNQKNQNSNNPNQNSNQNKPAQQKTNKPAPGKQPKIDKNIFKPEEIEDVDIIDNLNTLKVLDLKIKELEEKMKKIDGRTPREMLQKKVRMSCKKKQIEAGMGDGTISPADYMELMKGQLEHDQLLGLYMKQNNEEAKYNIIMVRIKLIKQEIEELKSFVK